MKKLTRGVLFIILLALLFQTGLVAYGAVSDRVAGSSVEEESSSSEISLDISENVLLKLKESNPENYEENVAMYQAFLVKFGVSQGFKQELERLIMSDYPLSNLLISYEFLYHNFGHISELEQIVKGYSSGLNWEDLFTAYYNSQETFVPREFAQEQLEQLMQNPSINPDDIMIADRLSFVTGKDFDSFIDSKMKNAHWQTITAQEGILYNEDSLPRVQITLEEVDKYTKQGMSEDQITHAFVLAYKLGMDSNSAIDRIKKGDTEATIMADSLSQKYN